MDETKVIRTLKLIIALCKAEDAGSEDWWIDLAVTAADAQELLKTHIDDNQ